MFGVRPKSAYGIRHHHLHSVNSLLIPLALPYDADMLLERGHSSGSVNSGFRRLSGQTLASGSSINQLTEPHRRADS